MAMNLEPHFDARPVYAESLSPGGGASGDTWPSESVRAWGTISKLFCVEQGVNSIPEEFGEPGELSDPTVGVDIPPPKNTDGPGGNMSTQTIFNLDGTYFTTILGADGKTRVSKTTYEKDGKKVLKVEYALDGVTTKSLCLYDDKGMKKALIEYAADGRTATSQELYRDGVKTSSFVFADDGTTVKAATMFRPDGTILSTTDYAADGSRVTWLYLGGGRKSILYYDQTGRNTITREFDKNGEMSSEHLHSKYGFTISAYYDGSSYQHIHPTKKYK